MTLSSLIKDEQREFDAEFPNARGLFENGDPYNLRRHAIKEWLASSMKKIALAAIEAGRVEKKLDGKIGSVTVRFTEYNNALSAVEAKQREFMDV